MHELSSTLRQDVSHFSDTTEMTEGSPTYLFNVLTECHTLIKNDLNIPHSVTGGQSKAMQSKRLVRHHVSTILGTSF